MYRSAVPVVTIFPARSFCRTDCPGTGGEKNYYTNKKNSPVSHKLVLIIDVHKTLYSFKNFACFVFIAMFYYLGNNLGDFLSG
jgi:hypothetical protein